MHPHVSQRLETFVSYFVQEFELYIDVQKEILEDKTSASDNYKKLVQNSIEGLLKSPVGMLGKVGEGIKDCLITQKKIDLAGKLITLVTLYQDVERKLKMRGTLVEAAFELFRSFEFQFMSLEKTHGSWFKAMLHLARTCVWCFMRYYVFHEHEQDELTTKFVLEAFTLKLAQNIRFWKKFWYSGMKSGTKLKNTENDVKMDLVDLFRKAGLLVEENQVLKYYKNSLTNHEQFNFRRLFTHEIEDLDRIKIEYEQVNFSGISYEYSIEMTSATKETVCKDLVKKINDLDESQMEKRFEENMKRIVENSIEGYMGSLLQQMNSILINGNADTHSSEGICVTNQTSQINNQNFAKNIQNYDGVIFEKTVNIIMQ